MSSACNYIKTDSQEVISNVVCAMCSKCLIFVNHDKCLCNYENDKNSCGKKQKAKVYVKEIQKKYQPKVKKPKKVGTLERLTTPKPRKPRFLLRWSPTGRLFDQEGKLAASSNSESQYDCSNGDNACTSNAMKPNSFQILPLCLTGYSDLFMVRRFGLFQAYDRKSKASHQFRLEVYGKWQFCDSDLEVVFRRNACFVRNMEGVDLLKRDQMILSHVFQSSNIIRNIFVLPVSKEKAKEHLIHQNQFKFEAEITSSSYGFVWTNENYQYKWKAVRFGDCGRLLSLHVEFKNQMLKEYFDTVGISLQMSSVRTPQQNGVVERRNQTLVDVARTMLIFSRAPLFLWAEAIATACFTQNCSIIHRRFNKTPYELINGRKPDISFLHVFGALVYNHRTKKIMETINVSFDELSAMAFEQRSELDLLFEAMYDDYIGGQPSASARTISPAQEPQVRQSSTASTTIADIAPIPTNSSSLATKIPITSQDVNELNPNAMVDGNTFVNQFANSSTSVAASSSSQNEKWAYLSTHPSKRLTSFCYGDDDDDDYNSSIIPVLSTEESVDSLSMGDEHLDTISATGSNEAIKSSVEDLVPIPSESEGILEHMCDVPFHDNSPPLDVSNDQFEDFSESNDEVSSTDKDSFSIHNIDYIEASPPDSELISSELMKIVIPEVLLLAWDRVFKIKDAFGNKQYKPNDIQELFRELFNDVQNIHEELAECINTLGWNRTAFCDNGDDDNEDCTIAVTPDFLITDSLIMENEHLDTIPETESDEFIKSSVEYLFPIPSESEDFSDIESECDMPDCDDSQTTNFLTFANPLFENSTSSDDESSHEEVIYEISFKTYSNPLFDLDEEIISSEFNPIHNEDLDSTPKMDCFDTKSYLLESLLNRDESIPPGIDNDDSDSEGDNLFLERLLHDDPIPLPETLDFSYDVRVFLPFFTYPVTSLILLSSGSEDTIFDPGIYHFSSLEPGVSHRSGTFMKFNIYLNHLNESPMEILSFTCSPMDQ
nr:hypothetical protein [Tanacetum cinerariifolium]